MYVKTILLFIFIFILTHLIKAQTFTYSYTDPCTGMLKSISVPTNGVTVTYFGEINTFNPEDFNNGIFNTWANNVFSSFGGNNPCGSTIGISSSINMAQNSAMNVLGILNSLDAISSISGGGMNTNGVTESSKSGGKSDKKNNKNNNQSQSNGSVTTETNSSSTESTGSTETSSTETSNSSSTGSTGSTETSNSSSTGSTGTSSTGTSNSSSTESTGSTETSNSSSTESTGSTGTSNSSSTESTGSNGTSSTESTGSTGTESTESTGSTGTSSTESTGSTGTSNSSSTESTGSTGTSSTESTGSTGTSSTESTGSTGTSTESTGNGSSNGSGTENSSNNSETEVAIQEEKPSSNVLGGSVGSVQNSTNSKSTNPAKGNAPTIVLSSDFAGFNFKDGDVTYGGKGTAGWTSVNWSGTKSHGFMLDYTSANRGPNFTAFYASIKKKRIDLISGTGTVSFFGKGSLYGTLAIGQMWSLDKSKKLKVIYMATSSVGNVFETKFIGTAFIAGGMYDLGVGKRIQIKFTNLFIYAPYISYYNDMVLKSPYVIMPLIGTNIGITKKFKLNVNLGGTYAIGEDVLNFTFMMGTRFAI